MSQEKPKKKEVVKATVSEMENRVEIVLNHILMGRGRPYMVRYAAKEWGLASRMVDELIARAREEMRAINAGTREENIEKMISNHWLLYRQAMHAKDHYLALSILKEVAKIQGLNENHVIHTIEDKRDALEVPDQELTQLLVGQVEKIANH